MLTTVGGMMDVACIIIFLGFLISIALVSAFRRLAYRYQLLDIPNDRSSHEFPIPSGGGLGIVISFFIGLVLLHQVGFCQTGWLMSFIFGGVLLACIGLIDDFRHVRIRVRIVLHFVSAGFVLYLLGGMPDLNIGFTIWHWGATGFVVGLLGLVWLINLYNFMDGIDGLAASEAVFVASAVALLLYVRGEFSLIPLFLLLASAAGGFLIWNWSPARVFMGDTGSGFLGFIFGVLLIISISKTTLTPWQWVILLGCFWVDATMTLLSRVIRGEPWYQAHCCHAFQQAVRKTGSHKQVVLQVLYINVIWLLPMALLTLIYPSWTLLITAVAILPLIVACVLLKAGVSEPGCESFLDEEICA